MFINLSNYAIYTEWTAVLLVLLNFFVVTLAPVLRLCRRSINQTQGRRANYESTISYLGCTHTYSCDQVTHGMVQLDGQFWACDMTTKQHEITERKEEYDLGEEEGGGPCLETVQQHHSFCVGIDALFFKQRCLLILL